MHESVTELNIGVIRVLESQAAYEYWSAWHALPITFPKCDLRRVPDHWRTFGTRQSPLSGSPRLASDPGLGVLHVDTPARDSLACDLMEPVRPLVDGFVLDWIMREPLRRECFFEQRDGNCRLMGPFA